MWLFMGLWFQGPCGDCQVAADCYEPDVKTVSSEIRTTKYWVKNQTKGKP